MSLVLGESRLERYLADNPPNEHNIHKANEELPESRKHLLDSLKSDPKVCIIFYCEKSEILVGMRKGV